MAQNQEEFVSVSNRTKSDEDIDVMRKKGKFKKFRDDQRNERGSLRTPMKHSLSRQATRKILRTIRRRHVNRSPSPVKQPIQKSPVNAKRKDAMKKRNEQKSPRKCERLVKKAVNDVQILSDDDDCICIEPIIEQIVLDDDMFESSLALDASHTKQLTEVDPYCPFYEDTSPASGFKSSSCFNRGLNFNSYSQRKTRSPKENVENTINHSDILELSDSLIDLNQSRATRYVLDESVVFVNETPAPSYIPLVSDDVPNPIAFVDHDILPPRKCTQAALFTKSEKKQLKAYNDNAYNPDGGVAIKVFKRNVLIDGSNVAFGHGLNKAFSVKGIKICIDYFDKQGHQVKAIIPQFRLQRFKSTDPVELENLHKEGKVVFTPCKKLPGLMSTSYDDRFILQLACEMDAAIVSNDNYRDLINENSAFKKIIENRVIGYSWCNDIFILPKDPYGKFGPSLQSILNPK